MSSSLSSAAVRVGIGIVGFAAFTLPLQAPWYLTLVAAPWVFALTLTSNAWHRGALALSALLVLGGVLSGTLSPTVGAALSAATGLALANVDRPRMAVATLLLHTSLVGTLTELIGGILSQARLESAAPGILASLSLFLACSSAWPSSVGLLGSIFFAWFFGALPPGQGEAMVGLPAAIAGGWATALNGRVRGPWPLAAALLICALTWAFTPPRSLSTVFVVLPQAPDAPEAKYFPNYSDVLRFAGIKARDVENIRDVPDRAFLLLPWTTRAIGSQENEGEALDTIARLARRKRWTIVVAGEHTDLGGTADRVSRLVGHPLLRDDLTVPPGNADVSGPLRAASVSAWPPGAVLNRGASVTVHGVLDKILLAGDGWWAEPSLGDPNWVGDYIWRPGERRGRLGLLVALDVQGARFVVLGDNSALMSKQVIADPGTAQSLLRLCTLWPAVGQDAILILLGTLLLATRATGHSRFWLAAGVCVSTVVVIMFAAGVAAYWSPPPVQGLNLGESGFDRRNFNAVLTTSRELLVGNWSFRRVRVPMQRIEPEEEREVVFGLVDEPARVGDVLLSNCRRIGSLNTDEGPTLMDAQACSVQGDARVLLGTSEAAAALLVSKDRSRLIVILDSAFLAQDSPLANRDWLQSQLRALE